MHRYDYMPWAGVADPFYSSSWFAVTNPCVVSNGGCQMICRHSPPRSHACSCLEGYKLKSDGRSCSGTNNSKLNFILLSMVEF